MNGYTGDKFEPAVENYEEDTPSWKNLENALHQMIRMSLHEQEIENYHNLQKQYA
jgi:hypothetical protein